MCLDLMDFEGKDQLLQKLARYGDLREKLQQYMALALEEEFGVKFTNGDFLGLVTVADVIACIEGKC